MIIYFYVKWDVKTSELSITFTSYDIKVFNDDILIISLMLILELKRKNAMLCRAVKFNVNLIKKSSLIEKTIFNNV